MSNDKLVAVQDTETAGRANMHHCIAQEVAENDQIQQPTENQTKQHNTRTPNMASHRKLFLCFSDETSFISLSK